MDKLIPIIVPGRGPIPRVGGIGPRLSPFGVSLTTLEAILRSQYTPGATFVDPLNNAKFPLNLRNFRKIYADYNNRDEESVATVDPAVYEQKVREALATLVNTFDGVVFHVSEANKIEEITAQVEEILNPITFPIPVPLDEIILTGYQPQLVFSVDVNKVNIQIVCENIASETNDEEPANTDEAVVDEVVAEETPVEETPVFPVLMTRAVPILSSVVDDAPEATATDPEEDADSDGNDATPESPVEVQSEEPAVADNNVTFNRYTNNNNNNSKHNHNRNRR